VRADREWEDVVKADLVYIDTLGIGNYNAGDISRLFLPSTWQNERVEVAGYQAMTIEEIQQAVRRRQYIYSAHADLKRKARGLTIAQVRTALLRGVILEEYPDTGRGESCLVLGFAGDQPVHIVCGRLGEKIVLVTVYEPEPPNFVDPWTRGE